MNDTPQEFRQIRFVAPPGTTEVVVIRHGASEPYRPGVPFPLAMGHGDPALAEEGHEQSARLAERLLRWHERRPFAGIYVTPLRRTGQTIAPFAERVGLEPETVADLREVFLGEWEGGLLRQKMAEGGPIVEAILRTGDWAAIPGAESAAALRARSVAALDAVARRHRDERIAVVVHGGVIAALCAHATGASHRAFTGAENTSITELHVSDTAWALRRFNDVAHLDG